jgi:hypothetical protein
MLRITDETREELASAFGEVEDKKAVRIYLSGCG